jgi:mannose-6-phosphate isomerase class I
MKKYRRFNTTYERFPTTQIKKPFFVTNGIDAIMQTLLQQTPTIIALDTYPGASAHVLMGPLFKAWQPTLVIHMDKFYTPASELDQKIATYLGNDRVFGKMGPLRFSDYLTPAGKQLIRQQVVNHPKVLIVGMGASSIIEGSLNILVDCPRWELQLQYRKQGSNFHTHNPTEDTLKKYKRGFFHDWVMGDDYKFKQFNTFAWFIDVSNPAMPTMINQASMQQAITQMVRQPFRLVPYFDPGVWGGQWMKEVCDLPDGPPNYAWAFDGVPEENAVRCSDGKNVFTMPAQNLVYFGKENLLGEKVFARFGDHFPIRFDFLDTMEGGNLSLQVHPTNRYIQQEFGMPFTQDESYYILDCGNDGSVYLGFKEGVDPHAFAALLHASNEGKITTPEIEKYVNHFPVKRHDHVSIPAGTIHCSGKNTMVLEISATPYIFTFKLWDWGRLGLDGKPRPVHLQRGLANLDFSRTTKMVIEELMARPQTISSTEVRTGLHPLEFIETRRITIAKLPKQLIETHGSVNMANVVEGEGIIIESIDGEFAPVKIHYAETFIVPASVKAFYVTRIGESETMIIQAYVRNQ